MDVLGMTCVTVGAQSLARDAEAVRRRRVHQVPLPARAERRDRRSAGGVQSQADAGGARHCAADDSPHIRDLFHQKYRGSRYSFGYPACPNLEDQTKLFALLHPDETIGVQLTTGFLLDPEQSTSAIVVHHPAAKYFVA